MRLRRARPALYAIVVAPLLAPQRPLVAQGTASHGAAWLTYSGDHAITSRLALALEAQTRFLDVSDAPSQVLTRAGLTYSLLGSRLRLGAGYGYVSTRAEGAGTSIRLPEHRVWQAAQLAHGAGRVAVTHRVRTEQRRIQLAETAADGTPLHGTWVTSQRVRYQLRGTLPIAPAHTGARLYATAADELFASFGGVSGGLGVDQNRAAVGLGFRASHALRVEAAYLNQSSITSGPHLVVRTHVLQLTALSSAPLFSRRP